MAADDNITLEGAAPTHEEGSELEPRTLLGLTAGRGSLFNGAGERLGLG
jgi:hypothetical protein